MNGWLMIVLMLSVNCNNIKVAPDEILGESGELLMSSSRTAATCIHKTDSVCGLKYYEEPDSLAEFPGGISAWQRYLNKNLRYPTAEADEGTYQSGTVAVFIIDEKGKATCFRIDKKSEDQYSHFDTAYLNLIKKTPAWKPAKCNGIPVASLVKQPISVHPEVEE